MFSSVTSSYMAGHRTVPAAPVGNLRLWYDFQQGSCYPGTGVAVNDLTTYNNDGTFTSAPIYTASPTPAPFIQNQIGASLNCSFATNALNLSTTVARTVVIWMRVTSFSWTGLQVIWKVENSSNFDGYMLRLGDDGTISILTNGSGRVESASTFAGAMPSGNWRMLTMTAIASSTIPSTLYINATSSINITHGTDTVSINVQPLSIPAQHVQIADFRIYDYGLSQAEITTLFNATRGRYGV